MMPRPTRSAWKSRLACSMYSYSSRILFTSSAIFACSRETSLMFPALFLAILSRRAVDVMFVPLHFPLKFRSRLAMLLIDVFMMVPAISADHSPWSAMIGSRLSWTYLAHCSSVSATWPANTPRTCASVWFLEIFKVCRYASASALVFFPSATASSTVASCRR